MTEVTELGVTEGIRAVTTAFSKGKDQTLTNTNVLNASGNITYIECSAQITQAIVDALLNGLTSDARLSGIPLANGATSNIIAPSSNENSTDGDERNLIVTSKNDTSADNITDTSLPESVVDLEGGGRSVSVAESDSSVSMIASYEPLFIPEEMLSRFPSGQEVYVQKLFPLQYGFPLWFPQPSRNLPLEYRRKGISVGDVGAITSTGNFHFLFNISLPAGHPINPNDLPDDFVYLPEDKLRSDFQESFDPGHSAVSNLDIISDQDENTNDIVITCQDGNKGAILSIPDGASDEDLVNEWDLKEFISKNAVIWFRYARRCGLELNHCSLYLVTGHMKSKSWGIATFNKAVPERNAVLKMAKSNTANSRPFLWKKSGGATVSRTGPTYDSGLGSENPSQIDNQCLFLRGFLISLSEAMQAKIWSTSPTVPVEDSKSDACHEFPRNRDGVRPSNREHGIGSGGQSSTKYIGNNVSMSSFPDRNVISHPLSVINDILISMVPDANISIVHERSWFQLINQKNHGGRRELQEIIRSQFLIGYCEETGMCTIEPRKNASPHVRCEVSDGNLKTHTRGGNDMCSTVNSPGFAEGTSSSGNATEGGRQSTAKARGDLEEGAQPPTRCSNCQTTNSYLWRRNQEGQPLCTACGVYYKLRGMVRPLSPMKGVIKEQRTQNENDTTNHLLMLSSTATSQFADRFVQFNHDRSLVQHDESSRNHQDANHSYTNATIPPPLPRREEASIGRKRNPAESYLSPPRWDFLKEGPSGVKKGRVADASQKTLTCSIPGCGRTFTKSADFAGHIQLHGNEKILFQCSWSGCGKTFAREEELKRHKEMHINESEGCEKQSPRMNALNKLSHSEGGAPTAAQRAVLQVQSGELQAVSSMTPTPPSSPGARTSELSFMNQSPDNQRQQKSSAASSNS